MGISLAKVANAARSIDIKPINVGQRRRVEIGDREGAFLDTSTAEVARI
jgi:hypothetical protein